MTRLTAYCLCRTLEVCIALATIQLALVLESLLTANVAG